MCEVSFPDEKKFERIVIFKHSYWEFGAKDKKFILRMAKFIAQSPRS